MPVVEIFYDAEGSRLFQKIMELPEYYLTRAEFEIFSTRTEEIFDSFTENFAAFDTRRARRGRRHETAVLIEHLLRRRADFTYSPIDISAEAVKV
jgi:uncharacterized SAM-dependent methyltransferase